jgi:hypothetical protein
MDPRLHVRKARWTIVIAALLVASCEYPPFLRMTNYPKAVKSGFKQIPEATQIEDVFGEADHFISYSGPNVSQN